MTNEDEHLRQRLHNALVAAAGPIDVEHAWETVRRAGASPPAKETRAVPRRLAAGGWKNWQGWSRFRPSLVAAAILTAALIVAGVVAATTSGSTRPTPVVETKPIPLSALKHVDLPSGYDPIAAMAVSNAETAIWAWSAGRSQIVLWNWRPGHGLTTHVVSGERSALTCGANAEIAVDSSGRVWFGCRSTIVSYDPSTELFTSVTLPNPPLVPGATRRLPPQIKNPHVLQQVTAFATNSSGDLAIARMYSATVQVLDTNDRHVSEIRLPENTVASNVAFNADSLAIPLEVLQTGTTPPRPPQELLEVAANGRRSLIPGPFNSPIVSLGNGFLDQSYPGFLVVKGTHISQWPGTEELRAAGLTAGGESPITADGGRVFVETSKGAAVVIGRSVSTLTLPNFTCSPSIPPDGDTIPKSKPHPCYEQATDLTATPNGGLFFVSAHGNETFLEYLPAAAVP